MVVLGYSNLKYYRKNKLMSEWVWKYRKYRYGKGFILRVLGFQINVM